MIKQTPHTTSWEVMLEISAYPDRPCRGPQETIHDYQEDGRPEFYWEFLRQKHIFFGDQRVLDYCDGCEMNLLGTVEGCKARIENLDIFFRALNELAPESQWAKVVRDGTPIPPARIPVLGVELTGLREKLTAAEWPVAIPRFHGREYVRVEEDDDGELTLTGPRDIYAWNGEGPPGLIFMNEGYTVYLSRHGLMVKPMGQEPAPYVFRRLWREDLGVFGEDTQGEHIGFDVLLGRYPVWGYGNDSGTELTFEKISPGEVFEEILSDLDAFCAVAERFECGLIIKPR